jgi:hypothetical protein
MIGLVILPALIALWQLRHHQMPETARVVWAALIILVPLLGPIAFWLTRPGQVQADEQTSQ